MEKNITSDIEKNENRNPVPEEIQPLSFWQLLKCLKPPQVWAFFAIISAFITAAFGYGYKFNLEKKTAKSQKNTKEIQLSQNEMIQFQVLKEKEKFFKLYLTYLIAKENYLNSDSEKITAAADSFQMPFKAYIQELCRQFEKSGQAGDTVACRSEGNNFIVKFNDDDSEWKIDQNLEKFYLPN